VRIDERVLAGAVELIAHDLTAALGWDHARAQAEARDALDNRMQFLLIDLAWEQFDPAPGRRSSRTRWWRRSRTCSSARGAQSRTWPLSCQFARASRGRVTPH
jgi:hypothetical protein